MLDFIKYIQSFSNPVLDGFLTFFNFFSQQYFYILIVAIIYWLIDKKKGVRLAFSIIYTVAFSCGLKGVFKISRPYTYEGIRVLNKTTAPGYSFPSADSSSAAAFAYTVSTWTKKKLFKIFLILYVLIIGLCRMYFGLHFLADVLAGFLLGGAFSYCINKILTKIKETNIIAAIVSITLLPFLFFKQQPDFYKALGLIIGAIYGLLLEKKYVNFSCRISIPKKILRFFVGIAFIVLISFACSELLPESNLSELFEKFLITFFAVGIYPYIFKKLGF